jgi:hypothetical protein
MTFFSIFSCFSRSAGQASKKNITAPKLVAIFKRENFLNIGKNWNRLAIKGAEKKDHCLTNHYGKPNY